MERTKCQDKMNKKKNAINNERKTYRNLKYDSNNDNEKNKQDKYIKVTRYLNTPKSTLIALDNQSTAPLQQDPNSCRINDHYNSCSAILRSSWS